MQKKHPPLLHKKLSKSTSSVFWDVSYTLANVRINHMKLENFFLNSLKFAVFFFWFFLVDGYLFPLILTLIYKWSIFNLESNLEAYSEPCQTSKMEVFAKVVQGF